MAFNEEQLGQILSQSYLRADHEFSSPPNCLKIAGEFGSQIFATLGNFSTILAKPKVGKTTFSAILVSSLLAGKTKLNFQPSLPEEKKKALWIDTEQGKPECVRTIRLISRLLDGNEKVHPNNLIFLSLRQYNASQRIQITEYALSKIQNLGFVVIDGIRDFVSSINDEKEATHVADKLLKWTQEKEIHILTILHQNKGDGNARGHLGTELMNKAETVVKLAREESNGIRLTTIEPEFTRHKEFDAFSFTINEAGKVECAEKSAYQPEKPKVDQLTLDQIKTIIKVAFREKEAYTYAPLYQALQESLKKELGISFGIEKSKKLVQYLKQENYIRHDEESKLYRSHIPQM